jgi:hypothetical protein
VTTCSIKSSLAFLTVIVLLAGCGFFSRTVKPGEEFIMKPNDKVIVSGTGLEIKILTAHTCGRAAEGRRISSLA